MLQQIKRGNYRTYQFALEHADTVIANIRHQIRKYFTEHNLSYAIGRDELGLTDIADINI